MAYLVCIKPLPLPSGTLTFDYDVRKKCLSFQITLLLRLCNSLILTYSLTLTSMSDYIIIPVTDEKN